MDIFICHTSIDKQEVVRPLVAALEHEGIKCWVDEEEIKWGDSITQKVNEGLKVSRFVIVVLSSAFLKKNWPKLELFAALNQEATSGEVKVLPLLVGDKTTIESILKEFPLLNDKLYEIWEGSTQPVVDATKARLAKINQKISATTKLDHDANSTGEIPIPKLRKRFSQRDKDIFLKRPFKVFKDYFQRALSLLETHYSEIQTDFTEIHTYKFIAKIYHHGDIKKQCKIWIGGLFKSDGIAYSENHLDFDSDNSLNELINVEDDGFELKFRFSIGNITQAQRTSLYTPSEAAEMLWKRFSSSLEQ